MEIERKYLLNRKAGEIELDAINAGTIVFRNEILQCYIKDTGRWAQRVRQVTDSLGEVTYYMTQKRRVSDLSSIEIEIPITALIFNEYVCHSGPLLRKRRIGVNFAGALWEIDQFHNLELNGLALAEIELSYEKQPIRIPDWIGEEVTDVPEYRNFEIAKRLKG